MKKIKINFVDFWQGFDKENNNISNLLKKYYAVEISESPDYIFFCVLVLSLQNMIV